MYIPSSFRESDLQVLHKFIEQNSFGVLVSRGDEIEATHMPLLLNRDVGANGQLIGHMARANPQWNHCDGSRILVVFNGPHAYVSPSWYGQKNAVPTWNYVAVHVYGTMRVVETSDQLLDIVSKYVEVYERGMPEPWSLEKVDHKFIDKLLGAIIGFTIDIDCIDGKWKLNQNLDDNSRKGAIEGLLKTSSSDAHKVADLMKRT